MRQAGKTPQNEVVDIVLGEVTSVQPLKVKIENRELTESFLILGALCKETHIYTPYIKKLDHYHVIPTTTTQSAGTDSHSHTVSARNTSPKTPHDGDYDIMLWRGLKIGDRVLMLKVGRGQKYYILQREEGAIPT
jgi:hypothetical protein